MLRQWLMAAQCFVKAPTPFAGQKVEAIGTLDQAPGVITVKSLAGEVSRRLCASNQRAGPIASSPGTYTEGL
jgi:hypothetical protein